MGGSGSGKAKSIGQVRELNSNCFARAGLLGNPSDGYHGKAISLVIKNFSAHVHMHGASNIEFGDAQNQSFDSLSEFVRSVTLDEIDGGERLLKSALRRWLIHNPDCIDADVPLFHVEFSSNIPRQVGLAGSSAIVIAALRAYSSWFEKDNTPELLASMALAAEHDLGISAGLQDRVIQSLGGLVYMDFEQSQMRKDNGLDVGQYECLDPSKLPLLYVAYARNIPESTEVLHGNLKRKYDLGDQNVIQTIAQIADLAFAGKTAIQNADHDLLFELINKNFDLRESICVLNPGHVRMIEVARACGASAKYCGSGGAIIGTCNSESDFESLQLALEKIDCVTFKPDIA